jgi:ABC-type sugar transport system permease subunit
LDRLYFHDRLAGTDDLDIVCRFENYLTIFNTGRFQTNIRNLIVFTVFFLAACLIIGLLLAVLIDSRVRFEGFFRSVYIFPMALSFIVTGVVWQWLFAPGNWPNDPTGINLLFKQSGLGFSPGSLDNGYQRCAGMAHRRVAHPDRNPNGDDSGGCRGGLADVGVCDGDVSGRVAWHSGGDQGSGAR